MNEVTVQTLSKTSSDMAVDAVTGIVDLLHEPLRGQGWHLQNGRLKDPRTGAVVEFMLSKHRNYPAPADLMGKRVRFVSKKASSANSDDQPPPMIWKRQKPKPNVNNGLPFWKLEVSADVSFSVVEAEEDLFNRSQSQPAPTPAPEAPIVHMPNQSASPRSDVAAQQHQTSDDVRQEVRQMIAFFALTQKEVETSPLAPERGKGALVLRLFQTGCSTGLHRSIKPEALLCEIDPSAAGKLRPKFSELHRHFVGRDNAIKLLNMALKMHQVIRPDQTYMDLTEDAAAQALELGEVQELFAKAS